MRPMRGRVTYVALGGAIAALQACLVLPVSYWAPSAELGREVNTHCGIGPASTFEYRMGNVILRVEGSDASVQLSLLVPGQSSVSLKNNEVRVGTKDLGDIAIANVPAMHYRDFELRGEMAIDPREEMKGQTRRHALGTEPRTYTVIVEFTRPGTDEYYLVLPEMIADGIAVKPFAITFRKTRSWAVVPLNC